MLFYIKKFLEKSNSCIRNNQLIAVNVVTFVVKAVEVLVSPTRDGAVMKSFPRRYSHTETVNNKEEGTFFMFWEQSLCLPWATLVCQTWTTPIVWNVRSACSRCHDNDRLFISNFWGQEKEKERTKKDGENASWVEKNL